MIKQPRPIGSSPHAKAANRRIEQPLIALLVVAIGIAIFRMILVAADDVMLALLGVVVAFLLAASLFAGDHRRGF